MSIYFESRKQAGKILGKNLADLRYLDTVVLAVSKDSVVVAAQIAAKLHSLVTMMQVEDILMPDEKTVIGTITSEGDFTYNSQLTTGEQAEMATENRNSIEIKKLHSMREMHSVVGAQGLIKSEFFRGRNVIIVSDGVRNANSFLSAFSYLHDIRTESIIMASPIAEIKVIDQLHVLADRIEILKGVPNYFETSHYYDNNDVPEEEQVFKYLQDVILTWEGFQDSELLKNHKVNNTPKPVDFSKDH